MAEPAKPLPDNEKLTPPAEPAGGGEVLGGEVLDILRTEPEPPQVVATPDISPFSPDWARIVRPVAFLLLALLASVMLLPFYLFSQFSRPETVAAQTLDWGKTILPSLTGFMGAVVGYYFGTRNSGRSESPSAPPAAGPAPRDPGQPAR